MKELDLNADILPGVGAAGFMIGCSLDDLDCVLNNVKAIEKSDISDINKLLRSSKGVLHIVDNLSGESTIYFGNDVVRLKFTSEKKLYCINLFEGYLGSFVGFIHVGEMLAKVLSVFPIYFDENDEINYPDDESGAEVTGIGFYSTDESLDDNSGQIINGISIHDWSLNI